MMWKMLLLKYSSEKHFISLSAKDTSKCQTKLRDKDIKWTILVEFRFFNWFKCHSKWGKKALRWLLSLEKCQLNIYHEVVRIYGASSASLLSIWDMFQICSRRPAVLLSELICYVFNFFTTFTSYWSSLILFRRQNVHSLMDYASLTLRRHASGIDGNVNRLYFSVAQCCKAIHLQDNRGVSIWFF